MSRIMTNNLAVANVLASINEGESDKIKYDDVRAYVANDRIVSTVVVDDDDNFEGVCLMYYAEGTFYLQFEFIDMITNPSEIYTKEGLDAVDEYLEEFKNESDYFLLPKDVFEIAIIDDENDDKE